MVWIVIFILTIFWSIYKIYKIVDILSPRTAEEEVRKLKFLNKHFKEKDPSDYKKSDNSTNWYNDNFYCDRCLQSCSIDEAINNICESCGSFMTILRDNRVYRMIYHKGKWQYQIKYSDGLEVIREKWY